MPDHYTTLGVSQDATGEEIRAAYRKIAREHHPDVSVLDESKEKFIAANDAYEVLSDVERKRAYDAARASQRQIDERERRVRESKSGGPAGYADHARATSADALRLTMLLNSHRFKDADVAARQLLQRDPNSAIAYAVMAEVAQFQGDLQKAAQYFAYAAQYAPTNRAYMQKSMAAQEALERRSGDLGPTQLPRNAPFALGVGAFMLLSSSLYVVLAAEPAAFPSVKPIAAWPLSLIFMLVVAGLSVGVALSISGLLDVFDSNRGAAVMRVAPAAALGMVAVISFWVALAFYLLVGATQHAFNSSLSRLMGGVFVAVLVFTAAAYSISGEAAFQTFLWGGNVLYLAAATGWFVADSLKRSA